MTATSWLRKPLPPVQVGGEAEVGFDWVTEDGLTDRSSNTLRWVLESQFDSRNWPSLAHPNPR